MATYYGYSRVSTKKQDLETQVSYLSERAKALNMPFVSFEEQKTAKDYNRQVLEIISRIQPGDILGLYIASRLGRPDPGDEYIPMSWAQMVQSRGGNLEISGTIIDTRRPADALRFFFDLMQAGSDYAIIVKNTKRGRLKNRRNGDYRSPGKRQPFGFVEVLGQRKLNHDVVNSQIVKGIFTELSNGKGPQKVSDELNKKGILSPTGIQWRRATILALVYNPLYMGRCYQDETTKKALVEAIARGAREEFLPARNYPEIVSEELWWSAMEAMKAYIPKLGASNRPHYGSLYTGRLFCWQCHKEHRVMPLTYAELKYKDKPYEVYRLLGCPHKNVPRSIRLPYLDSIIKASLNLAFASQTEIDDYFEAKVRAIRSADNQAVIDAKRAELTKINTEIELWESNIAKTSKPDLIAKWLGMVAELEAKAQELTGYIASLMSDTKEKEIEDLRLKFTAKNYWRYFMGTDTDRKRILKELFEKGWVVGQRIIVKFKNTKTIVFEHPWVPNNNPHKQSIAFWVMFEGREQYRGTMKLEGQEILSIEVPSWVKSDSIKEAVTTDILSSVNWLREEQTGNKGKKWIALKP